MSISQTKYVNITSVLDDDSVTGRELMGRLYTSSAKLPVGKTIDCSSLDMVNELFGSSSEEYTFASKYFNFISVKNKRPLNLSFSNYNPNGRKCTLRGTTPAALADFKAITTGSIKIDMGGVASDITGLDFSSATAYADIATALQTAIRAVDTNGALWTGATVTYDATSGFILEGGTLTASNIGYASDAASGTPIAGLLKWDADSFPFISAGSAVETPLECVQRTMLELPTCGSFTFLDVLTTQQITDIAQWNHTQNVRFMFSVPVDSTNYTAIRNAVKDFDGVGLTYGHNKYVSYMPMAIMAATDYTEENGTVCYMYTQFSNEPASVTSDSLSNALDAVRINYYGQTKRAGKALSFYQRGYLQGSIPDMGVYSNEMWLKQSIETMSLSLLVSRGKIPANPDGAAVFRTKMQDILDLAVSNGTFQLNRTLSNTKKAELIEQVGDSQIITQLQNLGYWVKVEVYPSVVNDITEYYLKYILYYMKGDAIRKIEGTDILL